MGLENYLSDMEMCCRCSTCKFIPLQRIQGVKYSNVCPSISKYDFHSYSGGGRLNIAAAMLKDTIKYSNRLSDIVYNCQMCGACGVSCNYAMDIEVFEPISEFRIKVVEDGHTNPALDRVVASFKKTGSMVPPKGKRGDWASGLELKDATQERVDVLYHVGCLTSYDKDMQKLAKATAKIMQKAGVNFGIAGDAEMCCGGRAYQMGYKEDFFNQARKVISMIKKSGIKTVVTSCADCYQAFKVLYDKYDLRGNLEVLHIVELIDKLIKDGKLKPRKRVDIPVTYHDPCRLGRLGEPWLHWKGEKAPGHRYIFNPPKIYRRGTYGIYQPPREVLESIPGIKLKEMTRIKEYAWCCGAGGGVNESNPEFSMWTARERIEEAESTGVEAIVTACPWCEKNFNAAIKESNSNLDVYDIVELMVKAL